VRSPLFRLLLLAALLQPHLAGAQDTQWFGTWHLNVEKSTYQPGPLPYRRGTWSIAPAGTGVKMVYDLVGVRGGVTHMEWVGNFDGKPYRLQGPDTVVDYAYTRIDARTLDLTVMVDNTPAVRGRVTLSPDGRTITATTSSRNARGELISTSSVYDRR
jgi:hypothetical protein